MSCLARCHHLHAANEPPSRRWGEQHQRRGKGRAAQAGGGAAERRESCCGGQRRGVMLEIVEKGSCPGLDPAAPSSLRPMPSPLRPASSPLGHLST
ncbi:Os02g0285750 [Oryza sativa Japonica Group]|uniref:Os02g0285750 protein n=1 Tax=Oryza sativa subsp. japonica TaxID=39947 RepID=A0A0P0VHQ1_ORYSJ|nr:Os02g0285750 [Oryza sativa Japonica Group]